MRRRTFLSLLPAAAIVGQARAANTLAIDKNYPVFGPSFPNNQIYGKQEAKRIITEWFSFECEHCARFEKTEWPEIRKEIDKTGRFEWQFSQVPRSSMDLLVGACGYGLKREKWDEYRQAVFAAQKDLFFADIEKQKSTFAGLAKSFGITAPPLDTQPKGWDPQTMHAANIIREQSFWGVYGIKVRETPTFSENNAILLHGYQTHQSLLEAIGS